MAAFPGNRTELIMKPPSCSFAQDRTSLFVDGLLPDDEVSLVQEHLEACAVCHRQVQELEVVRRTVQALPRVEVPPELTVSLRVIASRERARRARWATLAGWLSALRSDAGLWFNNLMKPFAIPAAGGVTAAALIFSMIVSSYPLRGTTLNGDVPTPIYTGAVYKGTVPFDFARYDVTVDLVIDDQGRVLAYTMVGGSMAEDRSVQRSVENILLFTEFQPATSFGQRIPGRVRLSFRTSQIDVRG